METDLPLELIQHIQSFLDRKEAPKTCLLSKSWNAAWCTRPFLVFDETDFIRKGQIFASNQFAAFFRKTIDRYKQLNTSSYKVETLIIHLDLLSSFHESHDMINDALTLEPNTLRLTLFHDLPSKVFSTTSLIRLRLESCALIRAQPLCSRLTLLSLVSCTVTNRVAADILQGCPLIEYLYFFSCPELETVNVSNMRKLVDFIAVFNFTTANIVVGVTEFRYLRELYLENLRIDNEFFTKFSSRFPFIEDLILETLNGCEDIQISSHSMRNLRVCDIVDLKKMQFNVPNISKFVFKARNRIPFLSFGTTASRDWESHIELNVEDSWFVDLKEFLTKLSLSRISLGIRLRGTAFVSVGQGPCFPIPMVEDLTVSCSPSLHINPSLLRDLFSSCRPSFILSSVTFEDLFQRLIYKQLIQHDNKDLFSMYNLEVVDLELFDSNLNKWQTTPQQKLIDAPEIPHEGKSVRFRVRWGAGGITV